MRVPVRARSVLLAIAAGFVAAGAARAADPVAVVLRTEGPVQVQAAAAAEPVAAAVGMHLAAGDRLLVQDGGRAVLLFQTGRKVTATEPLTINDPEQAEQAGLFSRTVETLTQVATTDAAEHPNRQGMIRPVPGEPVPVSPRNGIDVLDVRPSFVWLRVPGAERYIIQLRRADGGKPLRYEAGADTTWTLPASAPALEPGAVYEWTVGPVGNGRVARIQRFRVAPDDARARVTWEIRELEAAGLDPQGDGQFLAALIYRNAGLYYEANRVLDRMEAAGQGGGAAFHRLRGEVYDALGRLEAAARAFARADETDPTTDDR